MFWVIGNVRAHKKPKRRRLGDEFAQQTEPLAHKLTHDPRHSRNVSARPVEAGDKSHLHWISPPATTIGIVEVVALAASAEPTAPDATITATRR
jgi:hypothetical protein